MFDASEIEHDERDAQREVEELLAAIARLVRLWGMSCGASLGAFRVLEMTCIGTGSLHADELFRFDEGNRAAALTVLRWGPVLGTDRMPISPELRAALQKESDRLGKLRGGRGNKQ